VISGPTWVASSPLGATFRYTLQTADVNHTITSAVNPCNADGCYGSYVTSSDSWPVSIFSFKGGNGVYALHDAGFGTYCLTSGPNGAGTHGFPVLG
jgi:hypothetical protein